MGVHDSGLWISSCLLQTSVCLGCDCSGPGPRLQAQVQHVFEVSHDLQVVALLPVLLLVVAGGEGGLQAGLALLAFLVLFLLPPSSPSDASRFAAGARPCDRAVALGLALADHIVCGAVSAVGVAIALALDFVSTLAVALSLALEVDLVVARVLARAIALDLERQLLAPCPVAAALESSNTAATTLAAAAAAVAFLCFLLHLLLDDAASVVVFVAVAVVAAAAAVSLVVVVVAAVAAASAASGAGALLPKVED